MQSEHAITGSLDSSPYIEEQYRSTQNVFTISEHTKSTSESTTKSKWMRRFKVFALGKKRRTTRGSRQLEQQQQQHILTTDHLDTTTTSQENTHIVVNHEEIICHPSSDIIEEIESSPPAALPMPEGNRRDDEEIGRRRRRHRSWSTLSRQLGYILRRPHHERTEQVSTHQSNSQTTQITTLTHAHSHTWPLTAAHTTTPFRHQTVAGPLHLVIDLLSLYKQNQLLLGDVRVVNRLWMIIIHPIHIHLLLTWIFHISHLQYLHQMHLLQVYLVIMI
jgi:co-chaperonin GroES (HSP10)